MKVQSRNKLILTFLFLAVACLIAIADRAPIHLDKIIPGAILTHNFQGYYDGIVHQTQPGPYVYRVLAPYLIQIINFFISSVDSIFIDLVLKILILLACQLSFFYYLGLFFSQRESFYGVLWLDGLLMYALSTIHGPSIIETTDLINVAIFVFALLALHKDAFGMFYLLLLVGTLNRETTWFLIPLPAIMGYYSRKALGRSLAALGAVLLPYIVIRFVISSGSPTLFTTDAIVRNIPFLSDERTMNALVANLHMVVLLGPLMLLTFYKFGEHPRFLRVATFITIFFIPLHYVVGNIIEARLWMPLFVLLIPTAMNTLRKLLPEQVNTTIHSN